MKQIISFAAILVFIVGFAMPALAQEEGFGRIDWVNGVITAYGYGSARSGMNRAVARISSVRAAKVDAMRNLLEIVKGVRIDSHTLVEDFVATRDVIRARVAGVIKGARIIHSETEWINGKPLTTIKMNLCLSAEGVGCMPGKCLSNALDLTQLRNSPHIPQRQYSVPVTPVVVEPVKEEPVKFDYNYDSSRPVTGVIFSLRGFFFKRVVLPVVAAKENGDVATVYSVNYVKPNIVRTYGIIRYSDNLDQARKIDKIGDNVLIIPVEKVTNENMLVINSIDARKIYETTRHGNDYLNKAHVVVCSE